MTSRSNGTNGTVTPLLEPATQAPEERVQLLQRLLGEPACRQLGIELKSNRFGFEPEVTAKIARRRNPAWRIYEVPISYSGRTYEEGKKIGLKDAVQAFFCIVRYGLFK